MLSPTKVLNVVIIIQGCEGKTKVKFLEVNESA